MGNLWKKGSDNILNGTILGALLGVLLASSNISFLHTAVMWVTNLIPSQYHFFAGFEYLVWGVIGAIAGHIIDRK